MELSARDLSAATAATENASAQASKQQFVSVLSADCRSTVQNIMRAWLPLSDAILKMVVRSVPDPASAQARYAKSLFDTSSSGCTDGRGSELVAVSERVVRDVSSCSYQRDSADKDEDKDKGEGDGEGRNRDKRDGGGEGGDEPEVVVFVSKMTAVRISELSPEDAAVATASIAKEQGSTADTADFRDREVFVALARVFSGTLRSRDSRQMFMLGHHHNPFVAAESSLSLDECDTNFYPSTVRLVPPHSIGLYLCLGPSIFPVDSVPAGNIVAIYGLENILLRTGTMCSTWRSFPLKAITFQAKPMLQVAVEPFQHQNLRCLEAGLQSLYQYDPVVEVSTNESSGQNTITCLGELHLELCIKALEERFAKYATRYNHASYAFV